MSDNRRPRRDIRSARFHGDKAAIGVGVTAPNQYPESWQRALLVSASM
jgi:hypothetical protein